MRRPKEIKLDIPHPKSMYTFSRIFRSIKVLIFGPHALRRRVLQELVRIFALKIGGHYIGDDYKIWLKDSGFIEKFKKMSPHNYFSMERKFLLKEVASSVADLKGDVAEAGSYVGVSAWFIANELKNCTIYLFDSFEGLSQPKEKDLTEGEVAQWEVGHFSVSEDVIQRNLEEFSNIKILKGWIPERFPEVDDRKFKFIHIDVDLYEPTMESLRFFYPLLVSGGIVIFDDYGYLNCPGAFSAVNEFFCDKPEKVIHLPTGQGMVIKR